jgi:hypothetical protein
MAPFLEAGRTPDEGIQVKFVTLNGKIYYSDTIGSMSIALEPHSRLARQAGADVFDQDGKPLVDDGGALVIFDGKAEFSDYTTSCRVKDPKTAREITSSVAKEILSKDKVA